MHEEALGRGLMDVRRAFGENGLSCPQFVGKSYLFTFCISSLSGARLLDS